ESLDALKELLDEAAFLIQMQVDISLFLALGIGWDDHDASLSSKLINERTCVIRPIGGNVRIRDVTEQHRSQLHLVALARWQLHTHGVAEGGDDGVDLR